MPEPDDIVRDDDLEGQTQEEEYELSSEELRALGFRPPRWAGAAGIALGVVLIALLVWRIGVNLTGSEEPEAVEPEAAAVDTIQTQIEQAQQTMIEQGFDTTGVDSGLTPELAALINDQFYMLLNAQVSADESEMLDDSSFVQMLFTPLIPHPELPGRAVPGAAPAVGPDGAPIVTTVAGQIIDTTHFVTAIDSLSGELADSRRNLRRVQADSSRMKRELDMLTSLSDSLRSGQIRKLALIIESMEPAAAAGMLASRSTEDIAAILFKVKPRVAARVVQNLPLDKRARIAALVVQG